MTCLAMKKKDKWLGNIRECMERNGVGWRGGGGGCIFRRRGNGLNKIVRKRIMGLNNGFEEI